MAPSSYEKKNSITGVNLTVWKMCPGDRTGGPWMLDIGEKWTGVLGGKYILSVCRILFCRYAAV